MRFINKHRVILAAAVIFAFILGLLSLQPGKADAATAPKCTARVLLHEDGSWSGGPIWYNGVKYDDRFKVVPPTMQGTSWQDEYGNWYFGVPWPVSVLGTKCKINVVQ